MKLAISDYLHPSEYDEQARNTHAGMAHFAGTGPADRVCRECIFFNGKKGAEGITNGSCSKYKQLMRFKGPTFPPETKSCKYFSWLSIKDSA